MITTARGNLLEADVDALVNTVNTVGVMGRGIALQFKRAYPAMFAAYERASRAGDVELGRMHVWETGSMVGPRYVINFPTKGHWRAASQLGDVDRGLDDLVRVIRELGLASVAVPPLGCGNGGLAWQDVEPLIHRKLAAVPDVEVHVFPPVGAPPATSMRSEEPKPPMTPGRAALLALMGEYSLRAMGSPTLIETQKLAYFLQEAGEPLRLHFVGHHYGPYADGLRHVLRRLEGHYISGFGDGSSPVQEAEPLTILGDASDSAAAELSDRPDTRERIQRVLDLVEGFESAYALELLATTHWILTHPSAGQDPDRVVDAVRSWSPRKGRMFTPEHVRVAVDTLEERGWAAELVSSR